MDNLGIPSKTPDDIFKPGAARFGNFIDYYSFNVVSERLEVIPPDFFSQLSAGERLFCLDIGCNAGDLTTALYDHLVASCPEAQKVHMLGIDLDEMLITRCKEKNEKSENITYKQLDIMSNSASKELELFLRVHGRTKFDLVTCFSTTMWIHLNHGDDGLGEFLEKICKLTRYILIEPQEWKSYKKAYRRMTRLNQETFLLKKLNIRDISGYLEQFLSEKCNMALSSCFGTTNWGRRLYFFKSKT